MYITPQAFSFETYRVKMKAFYCIIIIILNNIIHVSQIIIPVYSLKFSLNYKSIWQLYKWMNINMATYMFVNNAVNFLYNIKIHLQRTLYIQVSEHKQNNYDKKFPAF